MPGAPRNLTVKEVNKDYITVAWEAPESDGGTPVIQYIVEKKDATRSSGMWALSATVAADVLEYKVRQRAEHRRVDFERINCVRLRICCEATGDPHRHSLLRVKGN